MTRWALVPVEPDEKMIEAHFAAHAKAPTVFADVPDIWRAMLAARPALTDADVDELCRMMWGGQVQWHDAKIRPDLIEARLRELQRDADRARMRAFLRRIAGENEG